MASNLEVNVFDYVQTFNNSIKVQPKPQTKTEKRKSTETVIVKGIRKPLTKLNISLMAVVFSLLAIESIIYFHSVQAGINANKLQTEINKMREANDFLKVDLANSKELAKVEKVAVNALLMTPADSGKINYLPLPQVIKDQALYVTNIAPKDKEVSVPVGY